jgi:hypothetical protein
MSLEDISSLLESPLNEDITSNILIQLQELKERELRDLTNAVEEKYNNIINKYAMKLSASTEVNSSSALDRIVDKSNEGSKMIREKSLMLVNDIYEAVVKNVLSSQLSAKMVPISKSKSFNMINNDMDHHSLLRKFDQIDFSNEELSLIKQISRSMISKIIAKSLGDPKSDIKATREASCFLGISYVDDILSPIQHHHLKLEASSTIPEATESRFPEYILLNTCNSASFSDKDINEPSLLSSFHSNSRTLDSPSMSLPDECFADLVIDDDYYFESGDDAISFTRDNDPDGPSNKVSNACTPGELCEMMNACDTKNMIKEIEEISTTIYKKASERALRAIKAMEQSKKLLLEHKKKNDIIEGNRRVALKRIRLVFEIDLIFRILIK